VVVKVIIPALAMAVKILALALLSVTAHAAKHSVMWQFPPDPPTLEVAVGDTVEFTWSGNHNVWSLPTQAAYDECDVKKGHPMCDRSPCTLQIIAYAEPLLFACNNAFGAHCLTGMKMDFTMPSISTTTVIPYQTVNQSLILPETYQGVKHSVMWQSPPDPPTFEVKVGDVIEFTWSGDHNVWSLPNQEAYDECDVTKGTQICSQSPCSLNIIAYAAPLLFVCQKANGAHCRTGMKMNLTMPSISTTTALPYKLISQPGINQSGGNHSLTNLSLSGHMDSAASIDPAKSFMMSVLVAAFGLCSARV